MPPATRNRPGAFPAPRSGGTTRESGFGLACVPEDMVGPYLDQGLLVSGLADWYPPYSGYHLSSEPAPAFGGVLQNLIRKVLESQNTHEEQR